MPLANETWTTVSVHEVHLAFLQSEREAFSRLLDPAGLQLIDGPDLTNREQNALRMRLLYARRAPVLGEIPPDTTWHRVEFLRDAHVGELRVIRCGEWIDEEHAPVDDRTLARISAWRPAELEGSPGQWNHLILWGHNTEGPFTILEGNHRLIAYSSEAERPPFALPVYVGISESNCAYHEGDAFIALLRDYWKF